MKLQLLFKLSCIYNKVMVFFLFIIMIIEFYTMTMKDYERLTSLQSSISIKIILPYLCNFEPVILENYYN